MLKNNLNLLSKFLSKCEGECVVLTGAGISTYSGIPDYRGPKGVYTRDKNFKPITYQIFMANEENRRRYWSRSYLGWNTISNAKKSVVHKSLELLEQKKMINGVVTQNVDGLHGGIDQLTELHGTLHKVECQNCKHKIERSELQNKLQLLNSDFKINEDILPDVASSSTEKNPDGDVENQNFENFKYPNCENCSMGILKPNVVFFGENIPINIVEKSYEMIRKSKGVLVIGSSLTVYSSFRLIQYAQKLKIPVCILNLGETRGDGLDGILKIDDVGSLISKLAR
ncbi:NAD-dependent protein lipoamidase sirtuin-4 [Clydaea vesicula]|uniref:NAD-dependent protein lipoamidase sirtuin-4 n=1 Tax=Clydaea vesicula TaxID=447962 RepID=A0AAD5U745_9FUNG|nr:NAD-dependent protein lipoamidase sirtuin-4 [Clydaea vesicula]KAJ3390745.1 NAD-dependent protein lipoamidase sirtuin-4 [Lobulomyces angularis]